VAESAVEVRRDFRVSANEGSLGDRESPHLGAPEVEVHPTEVLDDRPPVVQEAESQLLGAVSEVEMVVG
jgi:hypothetical protein